MVNIDFSASAGDHIMANKAMHERFIDVEYDVPAAAALDRARVALVVTDWVELAGLHSEFDATVKLVIVDGRQIVRLREGITYEGLTR